ncbi:MAG TPA: LysR family transcriptional regulator [Stellaceae bacterium]|nr:LysR family transcriptional regulator [Stellaceae bacterium]
MRFDLTDLRLFTAVTRHGSITRGAEAMNLALASASQRVSGMEAVLGVALLERTARGVHLTEAGRELLRHAEEILLRTDRMLGQLKEFSHGQRGRIRLLSNTGALLGFLPDALKSFLLAHPGIDVEVEEHASVEIVQLVTEGAAELGIVANVVDPGLLRLERLVEDRLVVVVPAGHAFASQAQVDFAAVLCEPLVGLLDAALERHLAEHAQRRHARPSHRVRLRSVGGIGRMVEGGVGLAILPVSTLPDLVGMNLAFVPLAESWARRRLALCLRDEKELTPQARLLMDHLVAAKDTVLGEGVRECS